jgi:hypothetical protein
MVTRIIGALHGAARQLRRDPKYAALLIVTMGIGIAAATAIFTVARGVCAGQAPV